MLMVLAGLERDLFREKGLSPNHFLSSAQGKAPGPPKTNTLLKDDILGRPTHVISIFMEGVKSYVDLKSGV